jgi:hypothetical protein
VAAKALEQFPEQRGRPKKGEEKVDGSSIILSRQKVAKTFKVGEKYVQQAKALREDAPDLAGQVESCSLSLAAAYFGDAATATRSVPEGQGHAACCQVRRPRQ